MMTAALPASADVWARICSSPEVADTARTHGLASPYTADQVIFATRRRGRDWLLSFGVNLPLVIQAGIGRLVLSEDGDNFESSTQARAQLNTPPDLLAARIAVCQACTWWINLACRFPGCGCSGSSIPERFLAKCPAKKWP